MSIQSKLPLFRNQSVLVAVAIGFVIAFAIGFVIGAGVGAARESASLPKDRVQAAAQISDLQGRVDNLMKGLERTGDQNRELQNQLTELQKQLTDSRAEATQAHLETEQAKAAKPDRYKIVKEGARTWRLDSATGQVCLVLAPEADWKNPSIAPQACSQ
jgi:peptidoglycan hydrolase CwlO-like protein